jgi:hypothetical protein
VESRARLNSRATGTIYGKSNGWRDDNHANQIMAFQSYRLVPDIAVVIITSRRTSGSANIINHFDPNRRQRSRDLSQFSATSLRRMASF